MSNIASLRRTDRAAIADAFPARRIATILAAAIFAVMIISFRPFNPAGSSTTDGGGDIVNQLGFGALGALSVVAILTYVDRRVLMAALSPWWLIVLVFFALSVANAADPSAAGRSAAFTLIGLVSTIAVLTLPRDADSFSAVLAFVAVTTIGLCFVGVVALPSVAIHSAASIESQHAGFWRGLFSHKNIAGPVMACLSFVGLYLWRRGWTWTGIMVFAGAVLFMANTGSKTTVGLVPLTIGMVMGPSIIGLRPLAPALFLLAFIGTALGTLGIVFIEPLKDFAAQEFPGLTYTGRTTLWAFSGEMLAQRPWTGYGYESFWGPFVQGMELPFDRGWDVRGIVHGHNGYLDVAVIMGIPAAIAAVVTFILVPLVDFMRVGTRRENVLLADLFLMFLLFTSLNSFLESFFFRRIDPVWVFFLIGVFGLRLVARFPVRTNTAG